MSLLCLLAPYGQACEKERRENTIRLVTIVVVVVGAFLLIRRMKRG